jgi:light-regulated signal transduction histidine kinase (bacteriophytochrome)
VDAAAALNEVLSSLTEIIRQCNGSVTYDALPEIAMSQTHLQQVFQNLITNALKYRTEKPPEIKVSAVRQGTAWQFAVRDNGIGIDPEYKEKIFGVFKRLHRNYSGTGIGLAICQRVVERYGGRIWVESSTGRGATFFFTVPEAAARARSATAESAAS